MKNLVLSNSLYQRNSCQQYSLVKNYIYTGNGDPEDFGVLRHKESAYIFQDVEDPKIGYRIYKSYQKPYFDNCNDASMIQRLYMNGGDISDVDFPYGVITKENRIIGQVIPYYDDGSDMANFPENVGENLIQSYFILNELCSHYIYYLDIHEHNFLITSMGMKLIDFDHEFMGFGSPINGYNPFYERMIVKNFITMVHSMLGYRLGFHHVVTMSGLYDGLIELLDFDAKVKALKK